MALLTKLKDVGGIRVEVTQLPYFRAQRLFTRLIKLFGPILLGLVQTAGVASGKAVLAAIGNVDLEKIAPMLGDFMGKLDPEEVESITRAILETTRAQHNGRWVDLAPVMDAVVGGDLWAGLAIQAFALGVHFGNFSSARGALADLGLDQSSSEKSDTSTDSKGENSSVRAG